MQKSDDFPEFMTNKLSRGHPSRTGGSYYTTKRLWRRQFTCIDMHKNSKIQHSISLQKFDRVFANSNIQHFKCSKILKYNTRMKCHIDARDLSPPVTFCCIIEYTPYIRILENLKCCILEFSNSRSNFRREIDCCILEFLKISMHVTCLLH